MAFIGPTFRAFGSLFRPAAYQGPPSDHFDGQRFFLPGYPQRKLRGGLLRWRLERLLGISRLGGWRRWTASLPGPKPPERVEGGRFRVTFVGHATVLLQTGGVNLLTDPHWSLRASPFHWAGPRRRRPPGIRFDDLPPLDAVLISHNHYDHLDLPTLRRLAQGKRTKHFLVPLGDGPLLREHGIGPVTELDWWQTFDVPGSSIRVTAVPARHASARGFTDHNRTLWCGYAIESPAGLAYFAGDTGFADHFAQIAARLGPPRLALLPIGAYAPRWFMAPVHLTPAEAVQAHRTLGARVTVPIHYGTFPLADDGEEDALRLLRAALRNQPDAERFWILEHGEGREVG